jgi:uncharacterized protein YjbI with pentapeptide repeats
MQGVDLTGLDCSGFQVRGALLKGVRNLAGATLDNLRGAVLDGCDVRGANLSGVDLSGALLKGVRNLAGATLDNLRGAVLGGCDVSGVSLSGVDCSGTTLGSCNLTGARLRGAIGLSGLRFAGAHDFPAVRVDALQPGDVVVHEGALRVGRVREVDSGYSSYSYINFEEGQRWNPMNATTIPCCQR